MIEIQVGDREVRNALARAASRFPSIAVDAMGHGMLGLRKDFLKDLAPRMRKLATGGNKPRYWRTAAWKAGGGDVVGRFEPMNPMLAQGLYVLEHGATLRPKTKKAMAIPAAGARSASKGTVRKMYREGPAAWLAGNKSRKLAVIYRGDRGLVFRRDRKGNPVGAPLWTLVRSVTIKPRLGLRAFWARQDTRKAFDDRIQATLVRELRKVGIGGAANV